MSKPSAKKRGRPESVSSDAILEAAEAVFAEQGFGHTSLRQLIAAAGVSTTAFYARFSSREAVLDALVSSWLTELASEAATRLSQARGLEVGFTVGIEVLLEALQGRKALLRLMLSEAPASPAARETLRAAYQQLSQLLSAKLQKLVERGEVEPADAATIGWALVGAIKMQLERWAVFEELSDDELVVALASTARAMLPVMKKRALR